MQSYSQGLSAQAVLSKAPSFVGQPFAERLESHFPARASSGDVDECAPPEGQSTATGAVWAVGNAVNQIQGSCSPDCRAIVKRSHLCTGGTNMKGRLTTQTLTPDLPQMAHTTTYLRYPVSPADPHSCGQRESAKHFLLLPQPPGDHQWSSSPLSSFPHGPIAAPARHVAKHKGCNPSRMPS